MTPYSIVVLCQLKIEFLWLYTKHKKMLENIHDIGKYNTILHRCGDFVDDPLLHYCIISIKD